VLAFTRRQTLDPKPTDVDRLAASMEELICRTLRPGTAVEVVGAAEMWAILVDAYQLENALLNLTQRPRRWVSIQPHRFAASWGLGQRCSLRPRGRLVRYRWRNGRKARQTHGQQSSAMPEFRRRWIVGRPPWKPSVSAITVVSLFAATLSMVSFVPQAWAVVRSRNTDGISLKMYLITVAGFIAWLAYGVLLGQWAIIVQNVICLCLSSFILVMKLLPQRKKEAVADALTPGSADADPR